MSTATQSIIAIDAAIEARQKRLTLALQIAWRRFVEEYGAPGTYSVEKGLEAIAQEVQEWARESGVFYQQERMEMVSVILDAAQACGERE